MTSHVQSGDPFIKTSIIYALGILIILGLHINGASPAHILGAAGGLMGGYLSFNITRRGPWSIETMTTLFWILSTGFFVAAL
jgi:hypothetical protein